MKAFRSKIGGLLPLPYLCAVPLLVFALGAFERWPETVWNWLIKAIIFVVLMAYGGSLIVAVWLFIILGVSLRHLARPDRWRKFKVAAFDCAGVFLPTYVSAVLSLPGLWIFPEVVDLEGDAPKLFRLTGLVLLLPIGALAAAFLAGLLAGVLGLFGTERTRSSAN